jgi:hypothetical protein
MPSSIIRNPAKTDDDLKAQQKPELDRWRTAIAIVECLRQAGISCELSADLQKKPLTLRRSLMPACALLPLPARPAGQMKVHL